MNTKLDHQNNYDPLEQKLASTLKPVKPSPGFIQTTRRRFNFASPTTVAQRLADSNYIYILLASSIGAALLIITIVRFIYSLLGRNK
jgi:hypothetical protein